MGFWSTLFGGEDPAARPLYIDDDMTEAERAEQRRALLKKVRKLEIVTRRIVNQQMAGSYHSAFKGRGMDFDEVRAYQAGDEVRFIDWNVSARLGDLYIKRFVEERELTVFLLVDTSASQLFGTGERSKLEASAEIGALLAFSAIKNNDRVGLIMFSDEVELFLPPKKGKKNVLRVIRGILEFRPRSSGTNVAGALDYLSKVARRRCVAFVISDFQDAGFRSSLMVASRRHDVVPIIIEDPMEAEVPPMGTVTFEDPESGELWVVDTDSRSGRRAYARLVEGLRERRERMFHKLKVDFVTVDTHRSFFEPLVNYFKLRSKRY